MRVDFFQDRDSDDIRVVVQAHSKTDDVEELMEIIRNYKPTPIIGFTESSQVKIRKDDMIRIYSKDKKVYTDTKDGIYLLKSPLYQLEETLPENFVRISNSEIVNTDKIIRLDMNIAGTIRVHLDGGIQSYVSRRFVSKVRGVLM